MVLGSGTEQMTGLEETGATFSYNIRNKDVYREQFWNIIIYKTMLSINLNVTMNFQVL